MNDSTQPTNDNHHELNNAKIAIEKVKAANRQMTEQVIKFIPDIERFSKGQMNDSERDAKLVQLMAHFTLGQLRLVIAQGLLREIMEKQDAPTENNVQ